MANTYTSLYYHIVFSTKSREPWIHQQIEERIWRFIGGIARKHRMRALQVGGVEDHIHAVINAPPVFAPCEIAKVLKGESSHWIHKEFPKLRLFSWQEGYAAFTISKFDVDRVIQYIRNQRVHHRERSFKQEYLELLEAAGIEYDYRYLWN